MENVRAGDIMIPLDKYPHIPYWFTLRQAMAELEKSEFDINQQKSLPRMVLIFDEQYRLMGLVRRRDILRGLEPKFLLGQPLEYRKKLFDVKVDPNLSVMAFDQVIEGIRERAERPVSQVMRSIAATVDFEDHLIKVIYEMVDNNISILPVLQDNKVAGVVRTVEVFQQISEIIL
jgi:predicted transcriptional regulator